MTEDRFYVADIRGAGLCMSGARSYFKLKEWDWHEFLQTGRPCSDLEAAGDVMALMTLEFARNRAKVENENGR